MMWLEEYHADGLRFDSTSYIRGTDGRESSPLPDGRSLLQWINREIRQRYPGRISIAEDVFDNGELTRPVENGGLGFGAQWDCSFVHHLRDLVSAVDDDGRSMLALRDALTRDPNGDRLQRIVYSESHDSVANGHSRLPSQIDAGNPTSWHVRKRSTLAAAMVLTAPGIPMLLQGQEFLTEGHFDDQTPLDWGQANSLAGIVQFYRDLIALRRNRQGMTRSLAARNIAILHVDEGEKIIAFHRWWDGGPGDDVVVVANFSSRRWEHRIGFPSPGSWHVRLNSDSKFYSEDFGDFPSGPFTTSDEPRDGRHWSAAVQISPYSVLILSQDPAGHHVPRGNPDSTSSTGWAGSVRLYRQSRLCGSTGLCRKRRANQGSHSTSISTLRTGPVDPVLWRLRAHRARLGEISIPLGVCLCLELPSMRLAYPLFPSYILVDAEFLAHPCKLRIFPDIGQHPWLPSSDSSS